jgi:hypothetical protein
MGVTLSVNSYMVADIEAPHVELRQGLGAYVLSFRIPVRMTHAREKSWWIGLQSVRVSLQHDAQRELGIARTDQNEILRQDNAPFARTVLMQLQLQPHQLEALEALRDARDLVFNLELLGDGGDGETIRDKCQCSVVAVVPRSQWIEQLRAAGALDVLLLEIPMSVGAVAPTQAAAAPHLRQAQLHFHNGHYDDCIGACRIAMEAIGAPAAALNLFANDRTKMTKSERGQAMYAAIRHFMHPAAHAGAAGFSRADAKLALQFTAACAAVN